MYVEEGTGVQRVCQPREPLFSTVTMLATHYWKGDETSGHWQRIYDDEAEA